MITKLRFNEDYVKYITEIYGNGSEIIKDIPIIFVDEESEYILTNFPDEKSRNKKYDGEYDICGVLGEYLPEQQEIKIYLKGISKVCSFNRKLDFSLLTQIVIIHELSHYLSHKFVIDNKVWVNKYYNYVSDDDKNVHELLAQLSTLLVIDNSNNPELFYTFESLAEKQSSRYTNYQILASSMCIVNNKKSIQFEFANYIDILKGLRKIAKPQLNDVGSFISLDIDNSSETCCTTFYYCSGVSFNNYSKQLQIKINACCFNL